MSKNGAPHNTSQKSNGKEKHYMLEPRVLVMGLVVGKTKK
jgi:hypothetical protein